MSEPTRKPIIDMSPDRENQFIHKVSDNTVAIPPGTDLKTVLNKMVGKLIDLDDIILDQKTKETQKNYTDKEKEDYITKRREALIKDAVEVITPIVKENSTLLNKDNKSWFNNDPDKLALLIADKLLEQKRGQENLDTAAGRVAKAIRDKADASLPIGIADDELIRNGNFVKAGLIARVTKELDRERPTLIAMVSAADSGKQFSQSGVKDTKGIVESVGSLFPDTVESLKKGLGAITPQR